MYMENPEKGSYEAELAPPESEAPGIETAGYWSPDRQTDRQTGAGTRYQVREQAAAHTESQRAAKRASAIAEPRWALVTTRGCPLGKR